MRESQFRENKRNSSSPSPPLRFKSLQSPNLAGFAAIILVSVLFSCSSHRIVEARPGWDKEDFWNSSEEEGDKATMETLVNIIVGVVVFFFVAIIAFIACLCCPICLLAKMRGRRRGVVYRSAVTTNNGTTVTTQESRNGTTITVTGPPRSQQVTPVQTVPTYASPNNQTPSMIAISNAHLQQSKPYPIQQSVTVVPVIPAQQAYPQHHPQMMNPSGYPAQPQVPYQRQHSQPYQHQQQPQYDPSKPQYSGPADPPPPYPGLTREIDNNMPYNPYFTEGAHQASAPPSKD